MKQEHNTVSSATQIEEMKKKYYIDIYDTYNNISNDSRLMILKCIEKHKDNTNIQMLVDALRKEDCNLLIVVCFLGKRKTKTRPKAKDICAGSGYRFTIIFNRILVTGFKFTPVV